MCKHTSISVDSNNKILNKIFCNGSRFIATILFCAFIFIGSSAHAVYDAKEPVMELSEAQKALNKLGYKCNTDGLNSTKTTQAIKAFQRKNKLKADGNVNVETQDNLIRSYLIASVSEVKRFKSKFKTTIYVESDPNDNNSYYGMYVGTVDAISTNRWTNFLIKKDLSEILVNEPGSDQNMPLEQWQAERVVYDAVLSNAEKTQIKKQIYASNKIASGLKFNLKLNFKSNNWYYLILTPISRTFTDKAAVVLQRKGKVWVVHYLGTGDLEGAKDDFRREGAPQSFLDNLRP